MTNASLATPILWKWQWGAWSGLFFAVLHLAAAALQLRRDRAIADEYMGATQGGRRDKARRKHAKLRKVITAAIVAAFVFAGLHGSAALYGMALQSFQAVDTLFRELLVTSTISNFAVYLLTCIVYVEIT